MPRIGEEEAGSQWILNSMVDISHPYDYLEGGCREPPGLGQKLAYNYTRLVFFGGGGEAPYGSLMLTTHKENKKGT